MGKFGKGVLHSFTGQVGNVVGSTWNGIDVIKSKPKNSNLKPTQKQIVQQAKFAFVGTFIQTLAKLFSMTFIDRSTATTGPNNAFQYNYRKALGGTYPAFTFEFSKVLVSKGSLDTAKAPAAVLNADLLTFTWGDNSGEAQANTTDKCIIVVYCPEANRSTYKIGNATRSSGSATIDVEKFSGMTVETWIAFISEDEREVSNSRYTGQFVIA